SNMNPLNVAGNRILSFLLSYITGMSITDGQTGLRAFKKKDFSLLDVAAKGLEYETKMTVKAAKLGYRIDEVPIEYRKRIGKSKLNHITDGYRMFLSLFLTALDETSSLAKTMIFPSILSAFVGMVFGLVSFAEYLNYGEPAHPYYPLISVLFLLVGAQFFSMGFLMDNLTKKMQRIEDKIGYFKKK
ncbi:MAG: glycosyltransferase family 2 protein, partial [Candidatus Altiarchaeota archaeon]